MTQMCCDFQKDSKILLQIESIVLKIKKLSFRFILLNPNLN